MDNKKTIELIKLNAIGCIKPDDLAALNSLMQEDENFPWKELGEFQNLAALLPSSLVIETPSWELKDKVARNLYKLMDEVKSQQEEEKTVEEPKQETEQVIKEPKDGIAIDDNETNVNESDLSGIKFEEQPEPDVIIEDKPDKAELITQLPLDKELIAKTTKEYVNSYFKGEVKLAQKSTQKTLFISIALFILSILLIVFMYLKFSGDADTMQEDIDKIKNRLGISLFESNIKDYLPPV
jgi:hypothetical protein